MEAEDRAGIPIFVVGFPRSGTTLLQALLGAHQHIAAPPEVHFLRRIWRQADYWGDLADDEVLRRVVRETVDPSDIRFPTGTFDYERVLARVLKGERSYAAILDAAMRDFAAARGKSRWSEKTPLQPPHVLWQLFPQAQVVHIVRDPRETVTSAMSKLAMWPDPIACARQWMEFTTMTVLAGARRGPRHYLRVRYEDLTRDPLAVMHLVCTFLNEPFDHAIVTSSERGQGIVKRADNALFGKVLEPIQRASQGGWHNRYSAFERARVAAITGPAIAALGYEAPQHNTLVAGSLLNTLAAPSTALSKRRQERRLRRSTPQQRLEQARNDMQRLHDQARAAIGARKPTDETG